MQKTINIGGSLMVLDEPKIMAIINVTPDSFYSGSRVQTDAEIAERAITVAKQGAHIIDIGGYSTRPSAADISSAEEIDRLKHALSIIRRETPNIPISIDTFRAEVVRAIYDHYGPFIVNDISAGTLDNNIFATTATLSLPYILGHIKGTPQTMAQHAVYDDLMAEISDFFVVQLAKARQAGVKDIILDPCFGFAKTTQHNFSLLKHFKELSVFELPLLAGLSRKSMIYRTLDVSPEESLIGTAALNWQALCAGASILRVHDVLQAQQVIKLHTNYENAL